MMFKPLLLTAACAALLAPCAAWAFPDTYAGRLEALAQVQALDADLLSHDSATETLTRWCETHHMASPAVISAQRVRGPEREAGDRIRELLGAGAYETIAFRRVRLVCGARVLSDALNWYLPGRLTADMNRTLARTDTPFGVVVRPLGFHRKTLDSTILLHPDVLPASPSGAGVLPLPPYVLQHRALLVTADGRPFSLVVETYTDQVLTTEVSAASRASEKAGSPESR